MGWFLTITSQSVSASQIGGYRDDDVLATYSGFVDGLANQECMLMVYYAVESMDNGSSSRVLKAGYKTPSGDFLGIYDVTDIDFIKDHVKGQYSLTGDIDDGGWETPGKKLVTIKFELNKKSASSEIIVSFVRKVSGSFFSKSEVCRINSKQ
mgnify:FL=1